jgi:hypothetical protein
MVSEGLKGARMVGTVGAFFGTFVEFAGAHARKSQQMTARLGMCRAEPLVPDSK